jgi:hypothetical protein
VLAVASSLEVLCWGGVLCPGRRLVCLPLVTPLCGLNQRNAGDPVLLGLCGPQVLIHSGESGMARVGKL